MALAVVQAAHLRVVCDGCRRVSGEVCGKRDLPVMARVAAVRKFKSVGWHHDAGQRDPGQYGRAKTPDEAEREGSGRWYCPECGRKGHL